MKIKYFSHGMKKQFELHCKELGIGLGKSYLLALSGGGDSVCLFHLLKSIGIDFKAVHCNYQLRGEESDLDEEFVRSLCSEYNIPVEVKRFDTKALIPSRKGNVQEVARDLRYEWFFELLEDNGYSGILTAHHLNDSIETSLFNFSRGTDIHGLAGISSVNGPVFRPLNHFRKKEILNYLNEHDFSFRLDSSNLKANYSRNKIRLEIIPKFEEIFEDVDKRFQKSFENIRNADEFIACQLDQIRLRLFQDFAYGTKISIQALNELTPKVWILSKLFTSYGFQSGGEIQKLINASTGKLIASKDFRLIKDRDYLLLTKLVEVKKEYQIKHNKGALTEPFKFKWQVLKNDLKAENFDVEFDCDTFDLPLTIRTWEQGDYFFPIGMKGRKKISDYFSDQKFSLPEKENTWLICSGDKIMHIVGYRQDVRFVVSEQTNMKLGIKFK